MDLLPELYRVVCADIQEILTLSQNGHYQIACTKYFEVKHGASPTSTAINHPNQFFEESQKLKGHHNNDESNHNECTLFIVYITFCISFLNLI